CEEWAENYCRQVHTRTEARQLICEDLRRRNPMVYDEEFSAGIMEEAKTEDARMNAVRARKFSRFRTLLGKIGL
ncbi:MAG: hypothetical protein IJM42_02920, partial [Synergistes sp.]|nr:hypothetical protein [Synergistes sp.]